jgi:hypothetical protein
MVWNQSAEDNTGPKGKEQESGENYVVKRETIWNLHLVLLG